MAAEIGIVASLIAISGAGITLTKALYDFGTIAAGAQAQVDRIGRNVSYYSETLDLLAEEIGNDRSLHSQKAVRLVEKLYDGSHYIFDEIHGLIPDRQRTRDQFTFLQRIAWNFKKTKVDLLVGELENLKSTAQLLVSVLCLARELQTAHQRGSPANSLDSSKNGQGVSKQYMRTQNVIVEWHNVRDQLPNLQEAAERDKMLSIESNPREDLPKPSKSSPAVTDFIEKDQDSMLAVIRAATSGSERPEDRRTLVLYNTDVWIEDLLDEWTLLNHPSKDTPHPSPRSNTANPTSRDSRKEPPSIPQVEVRQRRHDRGGRERTYRKEDEPVTERDRDGDRDSSFDQDGRPTGRPRQNSSVNDRNDSDSLDEDGLHRHHRRRHRDQGISRAEADSGSSSEVQAASERPKEWRGEEPVGRFEDDNTDRKRHDRQRLRDEVRDRSTEGNTRVPVEDEDDRPRRVQLVAPLKEKEPAFKPKGILKPARRTPFPEDPNSIREGVTPLKDAGKKGIPSNARWTKVNRKLVNPAALEAARERFEERDDYVIVLRVLNREEIEKLAIKTREIREARQEKGDSMQRNTPPPPPPRT